MAIEPKINVEELLPWCATGRLDPQHNQEVERAIRADPELAARLTFMEQEAAEAVAVNEALGAPRAASFDRLMAQVDALEAGVVQHTSIAYHVSRLMEWLFAPRGMRLAAACAVIVILLQAGVIGLMLSGSGDAPAHQTATGADRQATGSQLLVTFEDTATVRQINKLLAKFQAKIVDGPRADGIYRIATLQQTDQEKLIKELRESGLAVAVFPAGRGG